MDALSNFLGRKLIEAIEKRRNEYLRPLLNGQASDYPDYKARCAYLRALADIEAMIEAISLEEERRAYGLVGVDADRP